MSCVPEWAQEGMTCPYGRYLPLGITLPNSPGSWDYIGVIFGYVPWILCFGICIMFLVYRGTRELAVGLLPAFVAAINEIIKLLILQPRPMQSCLTSCGMPSSHSAVSVALLLYLVLDAVYRVDPRICDHSSFFPGLASIKDTCFKMGPGFLILPFESMSRGEFSAYLSVWVVLLFPVPISRILLNDHSPTQVLAGTLVGLVAVCVWFPFVLYVRSLLQDRVGDKFAMVFVHNYDIPNAWKEIEKIKDGSGDPLVDPIDTNAISI